MRRIFTLFGLTILLSLTAHAEWTGYKQISSLKAEDGKIVVTLDDFINESEEVVCDYKQYFVMKEPANGEDRNNYEARTSFLLAAYMSGKPVTLSYYNCLGPHISLGSVQLKK